MDYRKLNNLMVKDKSHIPFIDDLLDQLSKAIVFSEINLRAGYH